LTLTRLAGISTANAVDALTSTVNGFAATGISTTQILNKLVAVEQDYAVGAGDLAEALSRTGQAAQEAGVSLDQLNALVTSAQQSTARGGAVIGNALKTIFTRLQRTDTLDQLEAFNISVRDVQGNILPAVQILQNFAGAYKGLADAQRAQLSEQVAGVYQVNILKAIVNDLNKSQGTYAGALQRGAAATNEAEVATAKLNQTLDALLKQTATSTQQLANNIGKVTFEPLAKYGTEQLKSFIESLNEVLEGEGVGSTFANGLLKGIRNVIAGPGAIAAFFTLFKLIQNSFTYLSQALPQIAGITTETQNRKNIEQSILQIMQQQGPVSQALAGTMGNQAAQAQLLLQLARQQTAEYQMQTTLAKQLAVQLAGQGVRVKGSGGLQVTRAGGYIPNATKMAEVVGAQAGGYTPGRVVSSPVGGVMNTAEDVKYIPGFAQPFINPPAGSKAGRAHRQNAINRTGVDPYMYSGFIPNFAEILDVAARPYDVKDGDTVTADATIKRVRDFRLEKVDAVESNQRWGLAAKGLALKYYPTAEKFAPAINATGKAAYDRLSFISNELSEGLISKGYGVPDLRYVDEKDLIDKTLKAKKAKKGLWQEIDSQGNYAHPKAIQFLSQSDIAASDKELEDKKDAMYKVARAGRKKFGDLSVFSGFIPNFAPPTSAIRIPWFKKFGNPAFDAIQPALGISKASDTETFRQINFKSTAEGADERGDSNIFAPLYEDFAFKAMQLVSQPNVKNDLIRGYVLQPGTNQKQAALDAGLKEFGIGIEYKGYPKKNLPGSITGELTRKYETLSKSNPAAAAKLKELIIAFNEVGHENQIPSELGKKLFGPLAGTSYSQMTKNSPDLVKGLSAETNSLLNSYVKNPAFLAMAAASGFIPNFNGKKVNANFYRTKTGPGDIFPEEGTGLSGTNARKPGERLYGYMLEEAWNNMVMSILGNNVFIPDASSVNPRLVGDVNEAAQRSAKSAALNLSSAGRTTSLGLGRGMSENFGNSRYVPNPDAVYTGKVSGKMKKVNYDRLSKVLGVFWSSNPETKSAWDFLKNYAESGKFVDKKEIKSRTGLLRKSYEDWLIKNSYIGTQVKLSDYRKRAEGVGAVNYAALRSDLAGVSNLQNLGEMEKLKKYKEQGIFYGDYKNNKAMYDKMGRWTYNAASKKMILNSASGFIPNFAYKQAVMGLEESMSGNKAIFDTKPFPHIRNSSQPTFSSAIADHGGLSNALSDSMRGQKAAGLMSGGFVPNFGKKGRGGKKGKNTQTNAPASMSDDDIAKAIENLINTIQNADEQMGLFESMFGGRTKLIDTELGKLKNALTAGGVSGQKLDAAMNKASKEINNQQSKFAKSLASASTAISIAGPMIAGLAEQAVFGNKKREDMTTGERQAQSGLSTGLTAITTGAGIGAAFGPVGAAIGGTIGALIGLKSSLDAANLSVEELTALNEKQSQINQQNIQSASSYIESQKQLTDLISKGASSTEIETATKNLALGFNQIKDTNLQEMFLAAGGDVSIMTKQLQDYTNKVTAERAFQKGLFESGDVNQTISDLSISLNEEERKNFIKGLQNIKGTKKFEDLMFQGEMGTDNVESKRIRDFAVTTDILGPLLAKRNINAKTDKNFEANILAANKKIVDLTDEQIDELIKGLEKNELLKDTSKIFANFNKIATESYSAIFERIANNLQKQNFDLEKRFISTTGENRIQNTILEFSTGFNSFLDSFLSDTLDEFSKLQMAPQIATRKYTEGINKIQLNNNKFQIDQEKAKNDFLEKNTSKLTDIFKSNILQSQQNAQYFESALLPQIQKGNYDFNLPQILNNLNKQNLEEAFKTVKVAGMSSKINTADLLSESGRDKARAILSEKAQAIDKTDTDSLKNLNDAIRAINALSKSAEFLTNTNAQKSIQYATETAKQEKINFDANQKYLEEENRIRSSFEAARLKAETDLSVKRAEVDKGILLRLRAMRELVDELQVRSAISAARGSAQAQLTEARVQDPFRILGQGVRSNTEETIRLENQAIQERRKVEDATLNDQIQQAAIEIATREANTTALEGLTNAVFELTNNILMQQMGGQSNYESIKSFQNSYSAIPISPEDKNAIYTPEQISAYKAYQQLQQQRPSSLGGYDFSQYKKDLLNVDAKNQLTQQQISDITSNFESRAAQLGVSQSEAAKLMQDQQTLSIYQQLETIRNRALVSKTKESDKIAEDTKALQNRLIKEKDILVIQRDIGDRIKKNTDEYKRMQSTFGGNFVIGVASLRGQSEELINTLGRDLPRMFGDGLVDGIKAAIRESNNLGEALMGIASKFLDEMSTIMMRSAIYGLLGSFGMNIPGISNAAAAGGLKQKGGYIRAQSGMYISGTGSGDKYPALLENGEYVLNRNAVMAMGGPAEIDKLNFSMAPRFASGGSFSKEFTDLQSMEAGMTTAGLENSQVYNELRDIERQKQEQKRQKDRQRKQMIAGIVGSLAAAAVSFGLTKGMSNFKSNAEAAGAQDFAESGTATMVGAGLRAYGDTPQMYAETGLTPSDVSKYNTYTGKNLINPYTGGYTGAESYSGIRSFLRSPKMPGRKQSGGLIGSRLSDTIPAYAEGGLYNNPIVKKYGVGLQNGGMGSSVNNSNVVNNSNATNSFNFNTNVNRDGTIEVGSSSTSYKQQDVELSQNLNNKIYGAVLGVIKDQQRFGGSLAGTRRAT
jgi:TP901 family phage tail tape measure protein